MTDEIARELIELHEHPYQALFAAFLTLLVILACLISCGAILAAVSKIGVLL